MRGQVDDVTRERIEGWAWDSDHPEAPVELRVYDNGIAIGDIVADRFREGLEAAGIGNGRHAFSWIIPGGLSPSIAHTVEVRRIADGWKLNGFDRTIEADPDAAAVARIPLRGYLDEVERDVIAGWAWDSETPDRPVTLQIIVDRTVIARVVANRYRKGLEESGIGNGWHAFQVNVPGGLSPLTRHVIQVRHADDGREIPNSPAALEPSSSFDAALEAVVSNAVTALAREDEQDHALSFLVSQTERLLQRRADLDGKRQARFAYREFVRRGETDLLASAVVPDPGLRALVIDDVVPNTGRDAGSRAIFSHMRALQSLGYAVSFVAAHEHASDAGAVSALSAVNIAVYGAPYYASIEEVLRRQRDCFDVVYLHRLSSASKYLMLAREYCPRARILYSVADLHHLRIARQAVIEERPELLPLSRKLRLAECTAAFQADAVLTHSTDEAAWLRQSVPDASVYVAPWEVTPHPVTTPFSVRHGLAFVAGYGHSPNVDAARFLIEEVMPLVWARDASIRCLLAGTNMPNIVRELERPGVEIVGAVADLSEVFEQVRLSVAPLRYGAGVKGKVLESFAACIPCVMSEIAAEGIPTPAPLDQLVGVDAAALATRILRLHEDEAFTNEVSKAGLQLIAEDYCESRVTEALRAAIEGLA